MTVTPGPGGHGRARSGRALMAADPGVTAGPALAATAYSSSPACIVSGHDSESRVTGGRRGGPGAGPSP